MGKILIGIIILLLGGAGFYIYNRSTLPASSSPKESGDTSIGMPVIGEENVPEMVVNPSETPTDGGTNSETTQAVKEFTVDGSNFKFSPATISVNKGDRVRVTFKNTGGTHDFTIDEFNVATDKIGSGASDTVEFVADKAGEFTYYCTKPGHRANGHFGTLKVLA